MQNTTTAIETFSTLEPIAGFLLALVLAYLALPNLRYRDSMNSKAKRALVRLEALKPTDECCGINYCRLVKYAGDLADKHHLKRKSNHDHSIPESEDSNKYDWLFPVTKKSGWQLDTKIIAFVGLIALTTLNLGVIERSDAFGLAAILKSIPPFFISTLLIVINISLFVPLFLVWIGRRWVEWARQQVAYLERECEKEIRATTITGQIPTEAPSLAAPEQAEAIREMVFTLFPQFRTMVESDRSAK